MKSLLFFATLILLSIPAATQAQSVKIEYDHQTDFTKFKTYVWGKGLSASNPQIHALIVSEIDRQLQSKGWIRVEGEADLRISYSVSLDENINTSAVEYVKSDYQKWGDHSPVYGPTMVALPMARIVLEATDVATNKLVWSGRAKNAYTANQARGQRRINKAVEKLLEKFPLPSIE